MHSQILSCCLFIYFKSIVGGKKRNYFSNDPILWTWKVTENSRKITCYKSEKFICKSQGIIHISWLKRQPAYNIIKVLIAPPILLFFNNGGGINKGYRDINSICARSMHDTTLYKKYITLTGKMHGFFLSPDLCDNPVIKQKKKNANNLTVSCNNMLQNPVIH